MENMTYKKAGVDVEEGQRAVQAMKGYVKDTFNPQVIQDIGGFAGLFKLELKDIREPILVSGTDGVGTKLKIAFLLDKHDTIGQDCVAMCVNDILCQGAQPLFFLDYIATGKLKADKVAEIVKGVAEGCKKAACPLIGGETAEMPGFYQDEEYDMAGFAVGIVDRTKMIDGRDIQEGDAIIGLASSGIHSNGFSLVRKIFLDNPKFDLNNKPEGFSKTLGETLIEPTKIYVKPVLQLLDKLDVKGIIHVTGGGFYENIPRVLPEGTKAHINLGSWEIAPIFKLIQEEGKIKEEEMFKTFNMGIGMILIVGDQDKARAKEILRQAGEEAYLIGQIHKGDKQVVLCQE